jgi:REP element-mobilizing transposase RayT
MSLSSQLRLKGKDYQDSGWYFVTLGADYHKHLFGDVYEGRVVLSEIGRLVEVAWLDLVNHFDAIELGEYIVMPNHVHFMILIKPGKTVSLGKVVNGLKGRVTRDVNRGRAGDRIVVWQHNYYDVVIYGVEELRVRKAYIKANPLQWELRNVPRGKLPAEAGQYAVPAKAGHYAGHYAGQYMGALNLLRVMPKLALRVSRRATEGEIEVLKERMRCVDGVVVSTFFSPGERACLDVLLEEGNTARVLWVIPMVMPEKIFAQWAGAFAEGRALWLSQYELPAEAGQYTVPAEAGQYTVPAEAGQYAGHHGDYSQKRASTREQCMECNAWVDKLCLG